MLNESLELEFPEIYVSSPEAFLDSISTVVKNIKITYDLLILIFKNEHLKIKIE